MEKYIYDEKTGISYTLQGDYYLPDIALSTEEQQPVGLWGQRHARYLKQHHKHEKDYIQAPHPHE